MKTCIITNGQYSWLCNLGNNEFSFHNRTSAEYLVAHFKSLGYGITLNNDAGELEEYAIKKSGVFRIEHNRFNISFYVDNVEIVLPTSLGVDYLKEHFLSIGYKQER